MMQNYLRTKQQYEDCILLYRLGDFYEMFFEDAEKASRILDLTLTGRNCGLEERAPMCGIPYHAVDVYIAKLISAGEKVAICDQLTEPTKGKELVDRGVVRVVTPGTVVETDILDESKSNYICSIYALPQTIGIAFCDISTGEFYTSELSSTNAIKDLQELLVSYKPSEIITNSVGIDIEKQLDCVKAGYTPSFTFYDDKNFDKNSAKDILCKQYKTSSLEGFGLGTKKNAVVACSALLLYLRDTQKRELPHIKPIKYIEKSRFMSIDVKTRKNLELTVSARDNKKQGTLLWLLDKTSTPMGSRMLADWIDRPLQRPASINARLDGVEELNTNYMLTAEISKQLKAVRDIERIAGKISYNTVMPKECITLKTSLQALPLLKKMLSTLSSKILIDIKESIDDLPEVADLLERSIDPDVPVTNYKDTSYIKHGFNAELDEIYDISENSANKISNLEEYERNRSGIRTLKVGYNRVFGYYFEISKSFLSQVPENFIRKQTLTTGERFVSPELKELEEKILNATERKLALQKQIFEQIRNTLLTYIPSLQKTSQAIGALDCLISFATVAQNNNYCKPKINTKNDTLNIVDGRHPIVEAYIKRDNFITNDVHLDTDENRTMIITGPNMAGKSTFMRQVALITLMAHIGSFVPAKSAEIPIVDKIFTRVGASDDLAFNQSTFMVEMVEVANILNNATDKSLVILDEVGRGTSTFDGLSIAWAVMEYVSSKIRAKTLFATHYHELTDLEGKVDGVKNYRITVKEVGDTVIFLHKIARGGTNKSFGIEVAKIAGVPNEVCDRAKQIVAMLENSRVDFNLTELNDNDTYNLNKCSSKNEQEVASILRDIDINRVSPIEAFDILNQLVQKVKNK